ncbi:hypothetical protein LCGC14_1720450 [marine sediment metagenome]|uniref:Uncharacterized protein n=1 Tax=marine sediment metagenome TaxID=412755 RepID=A0A0F9HCU1_9ZZZZ
MLLPVFLVVGEGSVHRVEETQSSRKLSHQVRCCYVGVEGVVVSVPPVEPFDIVNIEGSILVVLLLSPTRPTEPIANLPGARR